VPAVKLTGRIVRVALGFLLGLAIAEGVFHFRDSGAFPHVNFFEPDPELAVKLRPNAEMKLAVPGNPLTEMHTNSRGFRGPEWPAPGEDEVLVVGDSQVFGLGVEDSQTFSAQLATLRQHTVINAGVPTYGPNEYLKVVERLITERHPKKVIFVLNLSNDLFELPRPNLQRHALWDGWAVRIETAPVSTVSFPGRDWVMSRSHLMFAMRTWLARDDLKIGATRSEGTWKDIATAGQTAKPPPSRHEMLAARVEQSAELDRQVQEAELDLQEHLSDRIETSAPFAEQAKKSGFAQDIVRRQYATEGSRPIAVTARELVSASVALAKRAPDLAALAAATRDTELADLLEKREQLRRKRQAFGGDDSAPLDRNQIDELFKNTKVLCEKNGAEVLFVALPLDVMVSADEWAKYPETTPVDMGPTVMLFEDLRKRALNADVGYFDATKALAAAEPGAFLYGDLHLTAKGHQALATALHAALTQPRTQRSSPLELPPGRSWPPTRDEWDAVDECTVKGSTAARCETKRVREWFRVYCAPGIEDDNQFEYAPALTILRGGHSDGVLIERHLKGEDQGALLPFLEGDDVLVAVDYGTRSLDLKLVWPRGQQPEMALVKVPTRPKPERVGLPVRREAEAFALPRRGEPTCAPGTAPGGVMGRCMTRCSEDGGCRGGAVCSPWPSGDFCGSP